MKTTIPITWTDNPSRITAIFTNEKDNRVTVNGLGKSITFSLIDGEDPKTVRSRIGELLAGKPVGDTDKIISNAFNLKPENEITK